MDPHHGDSSCPTKENVMARTKHAIRSNMYLSIFSVPSGTEVVRVTDGMGREHWVVRDPRDIPAASTNAILKHDLKYHHVFIDDCHVEDCLERRRHVGHHL